MSPSRNFCVLACPHDSYSASVCMYVYPALPVSVGLCLSVYLSVCPCECGIKSDTTCWFGFRLYRSYCDGCDDEWVDVHLTVIAIAYCFFRKGPSVCVSLSLSPSLSLSLSLCQLIACHTQGDPTTTRPTSKARYTEQIVIEDRVHLTP